MTSASCDHSHKRFRTHWLHILSQRTRENAAWVTHCNRAQAWVTLYRALQGTIMRADHKQGDHNATKVHAIKISTNLCSDDLQRASQHAFSRSFFGENFSLFILIFSDLCQWCLRIPRQGIIGSWKHIQNSLRAADSPSNVYKRHF